MVSPKTSRYAASSRAILLAVCILGGLTAQVEAQTPTAPSDLAVTYFAAGVLGLTWRDNSSNELRFEIWRKTGTGDYGYAGYTGGASFTDQNLSPNTTYTYRVRAMNYSAYSGWSNEANGTTPREPITVPAGGNLQQALDEARPGETLILPAGAQFLGPFTLSSKAGQGFITLQSSALANFPALGRRVSPADAPSMPKLLSPGGNEPALRTLPGDHLPGAHHFQFQGIEFAPASGAAPVNELIQLGTTGRAQNSLAEVPHDLVFDRCYIHGLPGIPLRRGIALQSGNTQIYGCYLAGFKAAGADSQAICGWNGPGPFVLYNNYLEAAGQNVLFGGADPSIPGLVPTEIQFFYNHVAKPPFWRGSSWTIRSLLELRNARAVWIHDNIFEHNWAAAQAGFALVFTVRNQNGTAPWSTVEGVNFANNIVRHSTNGIHIAGRDHLYPSQQSRRIIIERNLFEDISAATWGRAGRFLQITETPEVTVAHNTIFQSGPAILAYGGASPQFVFRDNILPRGSSGVFGHGVGEGTVALSAYFPGAVFARNVIAGANAAQYPPNNSYPSSLTTVGFVDLVGGNYGLGPSSPYRGMATDGTDIGCDFYHLGFLMP